MSYGTSSIRVHAHLLGIMLLAGATHARAAINDKTDKPNETATTSAGLCTEFVGPDFDQDCDVDLEDYRAFQFCMTGPDNGPLAVGCEAMDLDGDETWIDSTSRFSRSALPTPQ